jgi:hypothetical protein
MNTSSLAMSLMLVPALSAVPGAVYATEIPLEVGRGISVTGIVNGHQQARFCLDTGLGGAPVISAVLAAHLGLKSTGEDSISDPSGISPPVKVNQSQLESLAIGDTVFTHVALTIQSNGPLMRDCEGVLGLSLFANYLLTLDLRRSRLSLEQGHLSAVDAGVMPFTLDHGIPTVKIRIGSRLLSAHIDTMAPGLSIPTAMAASIKMDEAPVVIGKGRSVNGDFDITGAAIDDDIVLANYTFHQSFVEFNSRFPSANIGLSVLRNFTLRFDLANGLVELISDKKVMQITPPRMGPRS